MSIYTFKLPDVGEGMAEAEIAEWHVKPGDKVNEDDLIGAVMTDKAAVDIPSPVTGTVTWIGAGVGDVVAVGADLIKFETDAAIEVVVDASGLHVDDDAASTIPAAADDDSKQAPPSGGATPVAARDDDLGEIAPAPSQLAIDRPLASPAVRARAYELAVDLRYVAGSGPAGRIGHDDLDAYIAGQSDKPKADKKPANTTVNKIKLSGIRRATARKMQQAKQRIAHFSYVEEVDVTNLEQLRAEINRSNRDEQQKLTLLPFLMQSLAKAIVAFPQMNARFDDDNDTIEQYGGVHLGVAVQTDNGLMVPVIRHVESLDIWNCARELNRVAALARSGAASREELTGSTITMTSLGALGGIVSTPVINYPEVAIIGINRIVTRPMYDEERIVPRKLMNLSSSFDHRVIDGHDAASFIQRIKSMLEFPTTIFLDS